MFVYGQGEKKRRASGEKRGRGTKRSVPSRFRPRPREILQTKGQTVCGRGFAAKAARLRRNDGYGQTVIFGRTTCRRKGCIASTKRGCRPNRQFSAGRHSAAKPASLRKNEGADQTVKLRQGYMPQQSLLGSDETKEATKVINFGRAAFRRKARRAPTK